MRSFHANEEDGEESACASLGFSQKEVDVCNFIFLYLFNFSFFSFIFIIVYWLKFDCL